MSISSVSPTLPQAVAAPAIKQPPASPPATAAKPAAPPVATDSDGDKDGSGGGRINVTA
jgi:hypothetical protein